jgi:Flp pilus assembly protein TadG
MNRARKSFFRDESGSVAVYMGLALIVFLTLAALVIDVGHLLTVKNELQNAADACALAGARQLVPYITTNPPTPNWSAGQAAASNAIQSNKSDNANLVNCEVTVGYWNQISKVMQANTIAPTAADVPAVSVKVSRKDGHNAGAVTTFFAKMLGFEVVNVAAQSTAMISCPSAVPPKSVFPVAINFDFVKKYWEPFTANDPPQPFYIGSDYHYDEKLAGQWTSFFDVKNDVTTIRDLIYNGNPDTIKINQLIQCLSDIYIQPGTKTSIYSDVLTKQNQVVWVPVVETGFDTHAWNKVLCYLPIYIEDAVGANKKYIKAHFVKEAIFNSNSSGGPCYGGFNPPKIVK